MSIITIGHLNSDTDSIASAIALAEFLKLQGEEAFAYRSGQLNKESEWMLTYCEAADHIKDFAIAEVADDQKFFLVDFNEENQSPINPAQVNLIGLIDHHKLGSHWKSEEPIYFRIEPVGSTCTLITKIYREKSLAIPDKIARLLLCGIISDTTNLTSPSTAEEDRETLAFLTAQTNEKADLIANKLFEAKSDLSSFTPEEITKLDYKIFDFANKKIGIGVIETLNPESAKKMEPELKQAMQKIKEEDKLDHIYLGIVDILKQETEMLFTDETEKNILTKAFSDVEIVPIDNNLVLKTVVSRKKQIVPKIENFLKNSI